MFWVRPCLYGLGRVARGEGCLGLAELTFHLFLWKIQLTVYMRTLTRLEGVGGGGETTRVGELSRLGR